jgi:hypothetical protein
MPGLRVLALMTNHCRCKAYKQSGTVCPLLVDRAALLIFGLAQVNLAAYFTGRV